MKISDRELRGILAVCVEGGWAKDVLEELLAARKVVEAARKCNDAEVVEDYYLAGDLEEALTDYDKATEGE